MVDIEGLPATRSLAYANAAVAGELIFVGDNLAASATIGIG
jgi:hypothetical protein